MPDSETPRPAFANVLLDALAYPFLRIGWVLAVTAMACAMMWLISLRAINDYVLYCFFALGAILVRCYLTIVENTITGYGEEAGQDSGIRADGMWQDLWSLATVAAGSAAPMGLAMWLMPSDHPFKEAAVTLLSGLGCEYFCMALTGTVIYGGLQGAMPQVVVPAIWRSGGGYALASVLLLLVPLSFRLGLGMFAAYGFIAWVGAAVCASLVLIMQARLIGLVYLQNKERIGWE